MSAPKHSKGDRVSNGHWVGRVIAATKDFAWVQPVNYVRPGPNGETVPYAFDDGPLTFAHRHLTGAGQ